MVGVNRDDTEERAMQHFLVPVKLAGILSVFNQNNFIIGPGLDAFGWGTMLNTT